MTDRKISELTNITGANLADSDEFPVVDTSADETKAITFGELKDAFDTSTGFVRITGDTMTGDLTVPNVITSGNVDGRDVSADGTKLDTIETNADVTDTANVTSALNGGTLSSLTITSTDINGGTIDGTVIGGSTPAAGSFTTGSFTNDVTITQSAGSTFLKFDVDGTTDEATLGMDTTDFIISVDPTDSRASSDFVVQNDGSETFRVSANGSVSVTNDVTFGDNDKAIFGAGSDLQIYHNGSHSTIEDVGTGSLQIHATDFRLRNSAGTESMIIANADGNVQLYYDNSPKLATTSTGIDVTGTVVADNANISGSVTVGNDLTITDNLQFVDSGSTTRTIMDLSGSDDIRISTGTSAGARSIYMMTEGQNALRVHAGGDISFYEDTGTTPKFFWDASAESLGIGTSSPASTLDVNGGSSSEYFRGAGNSGAARYLVMSASTTTNAGDTHTFNASSSTGVLGFAITGSERMRIDSSGNVLVGTTSSSGSGDGIVLGANNQVIATKEYGTALVLNRRSNDGGIVSFQKDGSTVGVIGTTSDSLYVDFGDWTITESGGSLYFATGGTNKMKLDASGNLQVVGNVESNATII